MILGFMFFESQLLIFFLMFLMVYGQLFKYFIKFTKKMGEFK